MSVFCTSCGHNNPDQIAFCQACGKTLQLAPESTGSLSRPNISQTSPFPLSNPTSQPNEGTLSFVPQMPQTPQAPIIPIRVQQQSSPPIVQMGTIPTGVRLSKV